MTMMKMKMMAIPQMFGVLYKLTIVLEIITMKITLVAIMRNKISLLAHIVCSVILHVIVSALCILF